MVHGLEKKYNFIYIQKRFICFLKHTQDIKKEMDKNETRVLEYRRVKDETGLVLKIENF